MVRKRCKYGVRLEQAGSVPSPCVRAIFPVHWLVVSTVGVVHPALNAFDSLLTSTSVKIQVAALQSTDRPSIILTF